MKPILLFFIIASFVRPVHACEGQKGGLEGLCAPDFQLQKLDGGSMSLSHLNGKVILLNFWATWCEPCAIEIPVLEKLYHRLPKDVVLYTVSIDEKGKPAVEEFYAKKLKKSVSPFPILLDPTGNSAAIYGTKLFPETYIIDKSGRVRDKVEGMIPDWDSSIMVHYLEKLAKE